MKLEKIAPHLHQQREAAINAQGLPDGAEAAYVRNMHDFMVQGLQHLDEGNYSGWLACMELAGGFARDARNALYTRLIP